MAVLSSNATSASRFSVTAATTVTVVLAVNSARKGFMFQNNGTGTMFVILGAVAGSLTDYSFSIAPGQFFESPVDFTGLVSAIWSVTGGNALVTEFS